MSDDLYYYRSHYMNFSKYKRNPYGLRSSSNDCFDPHYLMNEQLIPLVAHFHFYNFYTSIKQFRKNKSVGQMSTAQYQDDMEFKYCKELYDHRMSSKNSLDILSSYIFDKKTLLKKIAYINNSHLLNFKLYNPTGLYLYDKGVMAFFKRYHNIKVGSAGEKMISQELSKHGIHNLTDINLPCVYMTKDGYHQSKNQIDVLSVNNHGIFVFEVKTYSHPFWINQKGLFSFETGNRAHPVRHTSYHPIFQQLLEHKKAVIYNLHRAMNIDNITLANLMREIYVPLVCVDVTGKHTFNSNYQYQKDYSRECNVRVLSQKDCVKYIKDKSSALVSPKRIETVLNDLESYITERYYKYFEPSLDDVRGMQNAYYYVNLINHLYFKIKQLLENNGLDD